MEEDVQPPAPPPPPPNSADIYPHSAAAATTAAPSSSSSSSHIPLLLHHRHHHSLLQPSPGAAAHLPPPAGGGSAALHHHSSDPFLLHHHHHHHLDIPPDSSPSAKRSKYSSPSSPPAAPILHVPWPLPSPLSIPAAAPPLPSSHHHHHPPTIVSSHPPLPSSLPLSPSSGPSSASAASFSQSSSPGGSAQLTPSSAATPILVPQQAMASAGKQQTGPGSPSTSTQSPRTAGEGGAYAVNLSGVDATLSAGQQPMAGAAATSTGAAAAAGTGAAAAGLQRKGKFVSPVWKPYEMLVLAKAWRLQYTGGGAGAAAKSEMGPSEGGVGADPMGGGGAAQSQSMKAKTRAEKDWEVAEYLRRHGVQRDVKTAATKWDNMLGDFRRVHEWEKQVAAEREESSGGGGGGGRSYFVLSSAERKLHRLPASFDEEVYDEMLQYVAHHRPRSGVAASPPVHLRHVPPQRLHNPSGMSAASAAPLLIPPADYVNIHYLPASSSPSQLLHHPDSPLLAADGTFILPPSGDTSGTVPFDPAASSGALTEYFGGESGGAAAAVMAARRRGGGIGGGMMTMMAAAAAPGKMKRVGRIKMVWEESVQLWAEDYGADQAAPPPPPDSSSSRAHGSGATPPPPPNSGRIRVDCMGFLNADQLIFLDDSFAANAIEAFERGSLRGYSTDTFTSGQVLKVFGRRSAANASVSQPPPPPPPPAFSGGGAAALPPLRDRTSYYLSSLKMCTSPSLPTLSELPFLFNEPPPRDLRFPLRPDVYHDLPASARDAFFVSSAFDIDCRSIMYEVVAPLIRATKLAGVETSDSFLAALWDDCINRIVKFFSADEVEFIRSSGAAAAEEEEERPNVCGLVRQLCLWRGEESSGSTGGGRYGSDDPAVRLVNKLLWTYGELPYVLGYYAVGMRVTFCALSRGEQEKIVCTSLATISLSNSAERMSAMVPCWRAAQLLGLLADAAVRQLHVHSDYIRVHSNSGKIVEVMVTQVQKTYPSRRRWSSAKRIYDLLAEQRIPCVERLVRSDEASLTLTFKPRGQPLRPSSVEALFQALKCVCTALVSVHRMSLMHRDVRWENVMKRADIEDEWFLIDFEDAVFEEGAAAAAAAAAAAPPPPPAAPPGQPPQPAQQQQLNSRNYHYPSRLAPATHAPEMCRGAHGLKVDVWGLGHLIQTCGLVHVPEPLKDLQRRFMDPDPDQRPSIDDSFFLLMQLGSSLSHFHHHRHHQ